MMSELLPSRVTPEMVGLGNNSGREGSRLMGAAGLDVFSVLTNVCPTASAAAVALRDRRAY
jgi:hypothetical protein